MARIHKTIFATAALALSAAASAQLAPGGPGWSLFCDDGDPDDYFSDDWSALFVLNDLITASLGTSGDITLDSRFCYANDRTLDSAGRLTFGVGPRGSLQSNFDDSMPLTFGAHFEPMGDYVFAQVTTDDGAGNVTGETFGEDGLLSFWSGESYRYMVGIWNGDSSQTQLEVRLFGDAARLTWTIGNTDAEAQLLGLDFAMAPWMRQFGPTESGRPFAFTHFGFSLEGYNGYTTVETGRPLRTERRWARTSPNFPDSVFFGYEQSNPYGIRVDNGPSEEFPDHSPVSLMLVGNHGPGPVQPGVVQDGTINTQVFDDVPGGTKEVSDIALQSTASVQRFEPSLLPSGASRTIVHYVRSTWSQGDYTLPFPVILDAPRLISANAAEPGVLSPNPFTIAAYIDNQYAEVDREVTLRNVRFDIELPDGMSLVDGVPRTQIIGQIEPSQGANPLAFVQWEVQLDRPMIGTFPYTVRMNSGLGVTKTIVGDITVSATPELDLPTGPSMVTVPYQFPDSSFDSILGLKAGVDYIAYAWDSATASYVPALSAERGSGYWLIPQTDLGRTVLQNAQLSPDTQDGGLLYALNTGWNLIGNPFSYPVRISELVVVAQDAPESVLDWNNATQRGFVSNSFVSFNRDDNDPEGGNYVFGGGSDEFLLPHSAYWIFVNTAQPLFISWPAVFTPWIPDSSRSEERGWQNDERRWRLQLSARSEHGADTDNFLAMVPDQREKRQFAVPEPPMAPNAKLQLGIEADNEGRTMQMMQAVSTRGAQREWKVVVRSEEPGEVTVTWPNLPSIPRNVRARISDPVAGVTRDLRSHSGYTFDMQEAGQRELFVTIETGGNARPTIGNVVVSRAGRDANAPVSVNYALSADALVTVRVLSGTGSEVYTIARGRSDSAGENSVTWFLKDNANRAVAPGVYRIEIAAETPSGERTRKTVVVNVTR